MQEKLEKYVDLLLLECLDIKKCDALFVSIPIEHYDLSRIVAKKAYEYGIKDIYFKYNDMYLKHEQLLGLSEDEMKTSSLWDCNIYNEYAKKGAAFLSFTTEYPNLMQDIDTKKLNNMTKYSRETSLVFDDLRSKGEIPWCIAAVPTKLWAELVYPDQKDSYDKLWNTILNICQINQDNPIQIWKDKLNYLKEITDKLNSMDIKYLHYSNDLGTDLTIELPKEHCWMSGKGQMADKREIIYNMPTEEVFSVPKKDSVNGIVYNSIPLAYNGVIIDKFSLEFENGKVINIKAEEGEEMLKEMIASDPKGDMLGEVALVSYNSPIRNTKTMFYETLFDENASCHLALGQGYTECIKDYLKYSKEELVNMGVNDARIHVDFMIGTKDLCIVAITSSGQKIEIFKNGNFTI